MSQPPLAAQAECNNDHILSVTNNSSSVKECCFLGPTVVHSHCYAIEELDIAQQTIENFNPTIVEHEECSMINDSNDCSVPSSKRFRYSQENHVSHPGALKNRRTTRELENQPVSNNN